MTIYCEGNCGKSFSVPNELELKTIIISICVDCYLNSPAILKRLSYQIQTSIGGSYE